MGVAVEDHAYRVAKDAEPWLQTAARVGYAAKGLVYGLVGVLALMAAVGLGGKKTNRAGAVNSLMDLKYGVPFVLVIGIGLVAYGLWRLLMAIANPEEKGALKRLGYAITGLAYGGFGATVVWVLLQNQHAHSDTQQKAAQVMRLPFGSWLLVLGAVVLACLAVAEMVNGFTCRFMKVFDARDMSDEAKNAARWAGRVGLVSRGVLFALIAWGLALAGLRHDPHQAGGLDQALTTLAQAPLGKLLLALVAAGLVCYAGFMCLEARFRKMPRMLKGNSSPASPSP